jgi:hypothetical protein
MFIFAQVIHQQTIVNKINIHDFLYSSIIGTEPSTAESLQPESNKENLLREGLLHCKITLVDGKVIRLIITLSVPY